MFKPSLLSVAIAASAVAMSQSAIAQEAETAAEKNNVVVEEVIVTGIRASLAKAVDIKREKVEIVESIVAEDIGKFPDNNVVEALQRVPGVQITDRASGEANGISIRGLTDVTTTINGRQMYISNARFYTMADIPASLISRVDVFKTRSASQVGSGIAGQVDVQTQRPFNFDGQKIVLNARGIYSDKSEEIDPSFSAMYSDRWDFDFGELGLLFNVSNAESNWRDQSIISGAAFPYFTENPANSANVALSKLPSTVTTADNVVHTVWTPGLESGVPFTSGSTVTMYDADGNPYQEKYYLARDAIIAQDNHGKRERPAANFSLQFSPNDSSEYLFEAFYNGFRTQNAVSMYFSLVDSNDVDYNDEIQLYDGTNIVKERTVYGASGFNSGDGLKAQTDSFMYALAGKWDLTDTLQLSAEAYTQRSRYKSDFFALRLDRDYYGLDMDFNDGSGVASLAVLDDPGTPNVDESDLNDASQYRMSTSWNNSGWDEGRADTFKIDADWALELYGITAIKAGLLFEKRKAFSQFRDHSLGAPAGLTTADMPSGFISSNSNFFDGQADFADSWAIPDGVWMVDNVDYMNSLYGYDDPEKTDQAEMVLRRSFEVEETTKDIYFEALYEYEVPGGVIDGSVGLRYQLANTDAGFFDQENDFNFVQGESEFSSLLPTMVVRYSFLDDYLARFAYTQTIRLPDFGSLNPTASWGEDLSSTGFGTGNRGNPNLEPTTSKNFDFSIERYFGEGNAVYATLFQRNIEGFVYGSKSIESYDHEADVDDEGNDIGAYPHVVSVPDNTSDGVLRGLELGLTYFPESLPGVLDGFGVQASFTALDSEQDIPQYDEDTGALLGYKSIEMYGVSKSSYSVSGLYERDNFSANLSYRWRDSFRRRDESAIFANPLSIYSREETSLDFQLSYDVTDEFVVTFDATNLTDEKFQDFYEHQDIYNFYSGLYSRTFALGIRYSY